MTSSMDAPIRYRFGHFELQPGERRLLASGNPVALGPRAFDLLVTLVECGGHLVTKLELLGRVWPNVVVEENSLQAQISTLRKILGRSAIVTVSGRGYRFVLDFVTEEVTSEIAPKLAGHNLPLPLTSFIGRETELGELKRLIATTRLLTVTGAGGCGKTRLALQLLPGIVASYPDGVWLVELAPLIDSAMVIQTVAKVLGVSEFSGKGLKPALLEHLQPRKMLLVFDNAEHVLDGCAQLAAEVSSRCRHVGVLVTSRERLGLAAEIVYRVPAMSIPVPRQGTSVEALSAFDSVRLFVERARMQRPHFAVTAENTYALASVCHRLGGIPLAIELAAPRLRSMSIEEIDRRLDRCFSLLTGGSRDALPRQRTLRALIDWSFDLLNEAEQALLCRLSVFGDGWTLDAAERICAASPGEQKDVLHHLASLIDKNLIVVDEQDGASRFGMLETIRQYAMERLSERGEEVMWRARHLAHFKALAHEAESHLVGGDQPRVPAFVRPH